LENRSNGKCNRGGRCPLFQAQTLYLRGDRHRDKEIKINRGETEIEKHRDKDTEERSPKEITEQITRDQRTATSHDIRGS
jgi:hypothetical protein